MLTFLDFPKQPATSDVRNPQPAAARRSVRAYDQPRATARAALRVRSANNVLPHRDLSPPAPGYRRDGSGSGRLDQTMLLPILLVRESVGKRAEIEDVRVPRPPEQRPDCLAGHVGLELANVVLKIAI
jgi:hypothetical protein